MDNLRPENVFRYFKEISDIPRGSGNTDAITEYLIQFAVSHDFDAIADEVGNVIIKKSATEGFEESEGIILQGHVDMVCAAVPESDHDFLNDPITLKTEGDYLFADGTTLGGDDGIAVAYMLALLDDEEIPHPALECLFTVDEEIGLLGAAALDPEFLDGHVMINLDSESEGVLTVGCAGGVRVDTTIPIGRASIKGMPLLIEIGGLLSGHSGEMIQKGRINALKLMGRFLFELDQKTAFSLVDVSGGDKDNAIPAEAKAHLIVDEDDLETAKKFTKEFVSKVKREYAGTDDGLVIRIESGRTHKVTVMDPDSQEKVIAFLMHVPNGVRHMSGVNSGLVQTSTNLGIARTGTEQFVTTSLTRSSVLSERDALAQEIISLARLLGGAGYLKESYPAWEYRENSKLRETMVRVYSERFGKEPEISIIHGGLECGIFYDKIKNFDAVSIGPDIKDIHTPNEKLSISSAERNWEYLLDVLKALK